MNRINPKLDSALDLVNQKILLETCIALLVCILKVEYISEANPILKNWELFWSIIIMYSINS